MESWQTTRAARSQTQRLGTSSESPAAALCLQIVDACLLGTIFVAPVFLGGRTSLGRFVFIVIACLACVAWFTRQALLKQALWTRTWSYLIGFGALLLVILQLAPLPADVISQLAPRISSLLPLWSAESNESMQLGVWSTLSLTPSSTKIALATLIAYVLLFVTVVQRLQSLTDIERLLRLIALAAILMSGFGLIQYFTSNGLFFWFYEHPFTTTVNAAKGTFSCRNHFAHFLALGMGPLLAWIVLRLQEQKQARTGQRNNLNLHDIALYFGLLLVVFAVLLSLSRGGAVALATVGTIGLTIYYWRGLVSGSFLYCFAALGILVIGMLSIYGYERVAGRLDDLTAGSIETLDSSHGRRKIWTANCLATQQGGMFGSGAGSHRFVYPIYLPEVLYREYTHAENGPLQIATECGVLGISLLGLTLVSVGRWCWQAIRQAISVRQLVAAVAVASGLAASVVHSFVDFVWFIPACMSMTILLAACALRLAQLSASEEVQARMQVPWSRARWIGLVVGASLASIWAGSAAFGPARASTHWDRYLITSKAQRIESAKQLNSLKPSSEDDAEKQLLAETAIYNLKHVLIHDPDSARAHFRLAGKYLQLFNARQRNSDNAMGLDQIRDAAVASQFSSAEELQQWLQRAFRENSQLLYHAYYHTRKALQLCPLQGQGYIYLANLCFLNGQGKQAVESYVNQSLQVRPYDGQVLFEVGRQMLLLGRLDEAIRYWQQIILEPGIHQVQIVRLLSGQVPASAFIKTFQPDWRTLNIVWRWYHRAGSPEDEQSIVQYAETIAEVECPDYPSGRAALIWRSLANMQQALKKYDRAIVSFERAFEIAPGDYYVRRYYGQALLRAEQYVRAESHLRWCLSRRPDDKSLHAELVKATKESLAQTTNVREMTR